MPLLRMTLALVLALLTCGVGGCTPEESEFETAQARDSVGIRIIDLPARSGRDRPIRVEVDSEFVSPPDIEYGRVVGLDVARAGTVAVLDQMGAHVTVLTASGTLRSRFGGAGGGPGEFHPRGLVGVVVDGQSVLIPDDVNQRITRFDLDGNVLETVPLSAGGGLTADWTRHPSGGYVYRVANRAGDRLVWSRSAGTDTIYHFRAPVDPPNTLMATKPLWAITPDGELWVGYTDRLEFTRIQRGEARPSVIVRRAEGAVETTEAELNHLRGLLEESLRRRTGGSRSSEMRDQMLAAVHLPTVRPRVAELHVGPGGTLWLNRVGPIESMAEDVLRVAGAAGMGSNEWEVLDARGNLLGVATLPMGFSAMAVADSLIYGVQIDGFGVETVQRFRVQF